MKSHCELIEEALNRGEKLTGLDILSRFQCMNYKGRIWDLRQRGIPVHTEMIKLPNGKEIALYSLKNQLSLKL